MQTLYSWSQYPTLNQFQGQATAAARPRRRKQGLRGDSELTQFYVQSKRLGGHEKSYWGAAQTPPLRPAISTSTPARPPLAPAGALHYHCHRQHQPALPLRSNAGVLGEKAYEKESGKTLGVSHLCWPRVSAQGSQGTESL